MAFWDFGVDRIENGRRQDKRNEEALGRKDLANHRKNSGLSGTWKDLQCKEKI